MSVSTAEESAPLSIRGRWAVTLISVYVTSSSFLFINGVAFLIPSLVVVRRTPLAEAALLASMPSWGMVVTLVLWGYLTDRLGERLVMTMGSALTAAAAFCAASVHSLFIAGTYTPFARLDMPRSTEHVVLAMLWGGALGGIALTLFCPDAPRWLGVALYLLLGWVAVWYTGMISHNAGVARYCSRSAAHFTASAGYFTHYAGPTRGRRRSAITRHFTRVLRSQRFATSWRSASRCSGTSDRVGAGTCGGTAVS